MQGLCAPPHLLYTVGPSAFPPTAEDLIIRSYFRPLLIAALLFQATHLYAQSSVLLADARHRPPEMIVDEVNDRVSGPLIEILNEAARIRGYKISWQIRPFTRTLKQLETGDTDLAPGVMVNAERQGFVEFIGPFGYDHRPVSFLVRSEDRHRLTSYDELKKIRVGVKQGTIYFPRFDADATIQRIDSKDDLNMVQMLARKRFDAMIVNDKDAAESVIRTHQLSGLSWADYEVPRSLPRYYALSKKSRHRALGPALSATIRSMSASGRIGEIYQAHGLPPIPTTAQRPGH
jgi:polar amino acid transport system substrate-binding protein